MSFEYTKSCDYKPEEYIKSIKFNISRYGECSHTLYFESLLTDEDAVKEVEEWLSAPITKEYFESVKDDLFDSDLEFEDLEENDFRCKGDLLTDAIFLECLNQIGDNDVEIECGS